METAYKMFNRDLTCTKGKGRFQYTPGIWMEEPEANCVMNGFHAAKNPLDCLNYYPVWDNAQCWVVEIGGDIDEDARDSKISCTRIRLDRRLSLEEFVAEACRYMVMHPQAETNRRVMREAAAVTENHFVIVRSEDPVAMGADGDVVALLKESGHCGQICAGNVFTAGRDGYRPDTWYNVWGEEVCPDEKAGGAEV